MTTNASSPASTGPAGAHFEGQIGAHYLLSMLTGTEPKGLPGTAIDRIELQRAPEGRPLDDVIIRAHDGQGKPAVLEIQVKRSISFTPSDQMFRAVVAQIAEASRRPDFWNSRYELAIAIAKTSRKIDGAYQEVLTWARQLGAAKTFVNRINRPGSANDDMRTFVSTFRSNLHEAGAPNDDEMVWSLLRKLKILVFDFTAQGSVSEELAKERAAHALHSDETLRAGNLWASLIELALQVAASGGDRTREELIGDLRRQSYRLAGDRRHSFARAALAEASRNALADIGDRVGDVMLTRHERVEAVHAALNEGRYIEIRGDAGVGKSGVLKHFAEQMAVESQVIVLSPGRTTPRGWTAMRAILGFDGTGRELLSDLACDGGAALFLDGLDVLNEEERKTVVDIVREAAKVPGFAVIVTTRRDFEADEQNWLPAESLDQLGRAAPVVIGELSAAEIDELRHAAPKLGALLADDHPARSVIRNLFRLSRLASLPADEPVPSTEIDMAEQWWRTADRKLDGERRERARLLKALANQALSRAEPLDVSDRPAKVVDALVESETLRDLGNDRVAFHHDVLREWAIANLLFTEPATIERLPLDRPAPSTLARGVELTARMVLERASDGAGWQSLLSVVSREGVHGSWRRAVLLALVRSEVGLELLSRVSSLLLADRAGLLRELIRTVMAVDVEPASDRFAAMGIDAAMIPASLNVPSGPSCHRLISWLLGLGESVPAAAIPDIVDLYTTWSYGLFGLDPVTPELLKWLYRWLTEIEIAREAETFREQRVPFGGQLDHLQVSRLETDLRMHFLLFCHRAPALAAEYLRSLGQRRHSDKVVRSILKFRGSLAHAAPAELAEFTEAALIPKGRPDERHPHRREPEGPFEFIDHEFLPASPTQGPFLELLTHAPEHGLPLIRRLVDHAIAFYSKGRPYGPDAINIPFSDGERAFPWEQSYRWSRESAGSYSVTSALMALEAWAHSCIEAGKPFDKVLSDVLGPPGAPSAFLLVAIDLLLSHWPKSREAAVPFLACPELLCVDRERLTLDNFEFPDYLGLEALQREPRGVVNLDNLKQRPSRRNSLEKIIGQYAVFGPAELLETLVDLLRRAAARLGPPNKQSHMGDPTLMVVHALNLADPNNWQEAPFELTNGIQTTAHQYVPPQAERQHFQALQEESRDQFADTNMQSALGIALDDPSRSSPGLAAAGAAWAQRVTANPTDGGTDENQMREEAVVSAAMIAMRDGDADLLTREEAWARSIFSKALQSKDDPVYRMRLGLRFNPIAIAFVGIVHLLRDCAVPEDVRDLLDIAARGSTGGVHGFGAAATTLAAIDERLPRAMLRCAFVACVRPARDWDSSKEQMAARTDSHRQRVRTAVDAELTWLAGDRPEPGWPTFPLERARARHHLRIPGGGQQDAPAAPRASEEEYADHQGAALWLKNTESIINLVKRPWLRDIVQTYGAWTAAANGAGLNEDEEVANPPSEWNEAYFNLLACCLPGLPSPEVDELALTPIISLPDEPFFDVVTQFLRSVDDVYFNDGGLQAAEAVRIRSVLAHRLMASWGWRRLRDDRSTSIEWHIGPAIAALFINDYGFALPPKCYLLSKGVDRLDPFIPVLKELVESGPCLFVALVTLNLLEVSPKPTHLQLIVAAAKTWLASYPDDSAFWIDHGIGQRVCALIDGIRLQEKAQLDTEHALRRDIDVLLADLVRLGVAEASRLETALADR